MGTRINTIMQTCFFAISGVLPERRRSNKIKSSIKKTYGQKGEKVVQKNWEAVDNTLSPSERGEGSAERPPAPKSKHSGT